MSETDESRPLTRRELRMRAMAEAGVVAPEPIASPTSEPALDTSAIDDLLEGVEISIVDEQGNLRSRREIRELRARAAAEILAARQAAAAAFSADPDAEEGTDRAEDAESGEHRTEDVHVSELEDIAVPQDVAEPHDVAEQQEEPTDLVDQPETTASQIDLPPTVAMDVVAEGAEEAEPAVEDVEEGESVLEDLFSSESDDELSLEDTEEVGDQPAVKAPESGDDLQDGDNSREGNDSSSSTYSFPDIVPLDDGQSVFDDPALRLLGRNANADAPAESRGDFDELIHRAVAQEGGTSSTSALILPNMPDTENLSGSLGDTGELFVTGSIEMPKSLSETGGHAFHDSIEIEPLDDLGLIEEPPADTLMAPVSAARAVSARSAQGSLIADSAKDKSKVPVVLIATGGVLVVGAVALIVWAASSGLFG